MKTWLSLLLLALPLPGIALAPDEAVYSIHFGPFHLGDGNYGLQQRKDTSYTLCTIPDWRAAMAQIHRVLKPDEKVFFCEHGWLQMYQLKNGKTTLTGYGLKYLVMVI